MPSPIYTQGDQGDFVGGVTLPNGRYLISVLADGYKIDGAHFTVPLPDPGLVTVELQPNPLPDSTLRGQVFSDTAPTNGTQDPGEPGLAGFVGHIADTLGEVQTDVYGNPLCTRYEGEDPDTHVIPFASLDADMLPVPIDGTGGSCVSDANGLLTIPHLGTNRYAFSATPPDGQTWIQTTTLEGNHDFDAWVMEGSTGYDTEFVMAGEPVPQPIFGFVPPVHNGQPLVASAPGHIKGVVVGIKSYTPPKGGSFDFWGGGTGTKLDHPIVRPWLSLADLQAGDVAVWVGQGNADGTFDIAGVPDGNYTLSWWDEPQNYNLNLINVTVSNGETVDMGNVPLNGWWTRYDGYVFNDTNRNGVKDPGEPGVPNFTLTMRRRENSLMDRGQTTVSTDGTGHYLFESAYPLGAVDGHGGLQRLLLHHRGHLPGRQPADPDHGQGRRRRCQRAQHHRPQRPDGLGRPRLRPDGRQRHRSPQRRHRRHGQLRHHPQRARPAVRRVGRLAARHLRRAGRAARDRSRAARRARPATPTVATSSQLTAPTPRARS